jgi:hypothetical protein
MIYFATALYLVISIYTCLWAYSAMKDVDEEGDNLEKFLTIVVAAVMGGFWPLMVPFCYIAGKGILRR